MITLRFIKLLQAAKLGLLILLGGLVALFWGLLEPGAVQADYQVFETQAGNYHVTVWARPSPIAVGKVHLLLRVGQAANVSQENPVRGAKVMVQLEQLTGPGTEPNSQIANYHKNLVADETDPGNYEMEDSLLSEGRYRAAISLALGGNSTQTGFEFTALPEPDDRLMSVLLLALFPLGLFTLLYLYVRRPKHKAGVAVTADSVEVEQSRSKT